MAQGDGFWHFGGVESVLDEEGSYPCIVDDTVADGDTSVVAPQSRTHILLELPRRSALIDFTPRAWASAPACGPLASWVIAQPRATFDAPIPPPPRAESFVQIVHWPAFVCGFLGALVALLALWQGTGGRPDALRGFMQRHVVAGMESLSGHRIDGARENL